MFWDLGFKQGLCLMGVFLGYSFNQLPGSTLSRDLIQGFACSRNSPVTNTEKITLRVPSSFVDQIESRFGIMGCCCRSNE